MTDEAIALLAPRIGTRAACAAAGVAQASWYRRHRTSPAPLRPAPVPQRDRVQPRALAAAERRAILDALHSERFTDTAPAEAWATLLDEGTYLGSVSTFYRVLREAGESRERRAQAAHPATVKPELAAAGPNQVYSWDITKLHGPAKWTYYHLYVILDIFSRYAVGWMVATRESAALAEKLIAATCAKQGIGRGQMAAWLSERARRCPFWLWRVWARPAWDLCLYLLCPRPDLMGTDPERRRWHGQD